MAQKMVYQWSNGAAYCQRKLDAQIIGERLEAIRASGELSNQAVLDDAKPTSSPLHPAFEWDDIVAANAYRLEQARNLIRHVNVVVTENGKSSAPVRAFVSLVSETGKHGGGYESITVIASNPEKREQLLHQALNELNAWRQRYAELQEFMRLHQAIDKMLLVIGKEATSAAQASA